MACGSLSTAHPAANCPRLEAGLCGHMLGWGSAGHYLLSEHRRGHSFSAPLTHTQLKVESTRLLSLCNFKTDHLSLIR